MTNNNLFEQVVKKIDPQSKLLHTWTMTGGVSAQVTALVLEQPDGGTKKLIMRQHGDADLAFNPQVAAAEFRLLQVLKSAHIAAPAPYLLDQSGHIFPTPYLVVEYVEGETEFAPANLTSFLHQLADYMARLHQLNIADVDLSFLPKQEIILAELLKNRPVTLDHSLEEGRIRDALEALSPLPQQNQSVLLHGDLWPGNVLWLDGTLVAVIDWEDARLGDPLADLAYSRLEILWTFGVEAMQQFTDEYLLLNTIDVINLPYWDLSAALRPAFQIGNWAADDTAEKRMREAHRWFVNQAFDALKTGANDNAGS